ncbi:hypothetical protein [Polaromonas glacialis]|uniref:hypothetical protein n=1 Tax=Polaromonas glacialis TaxID=866564 RepID=UPI0004954AA2|nr:hypothetical protein [Polaromonas glacialis]
MLDFYKPAWLYESLPYGYLAAGGLAMVSLDSGLAMLSSGLLIAAGIYIVMLRHDCRRRLNSVISQKEKHRRLNRLR